MYFGFVSHLMGSWWGWSFFFGAGLCISCLFLTCWVAGGGALPGEGSHAATCGVLTAESATTYAVGDHSAAQQPKGRKNKTLLKRGL